MNGFLKNKIKWKIIEGKQLFKPNKMTRDNVRVTNAATLTKY